MRICFSARLAMLLLCCAGHFASAQTRAMQLTDSIKGIRTLPLLQIRKWQFNSQGELEVGGGNQQLLSNAVATIRNIQFVTVQNTITINPVTKPIPSVWPNPFTHDLFFSGLGSPTASWTLTLCAADGKSLLTRSQISSHNQLHFVLPSFPCGIYRATLRNHENTFHYSIIKTY
jgi:hypothetical protein